MTAAPTPGPWTLDSGSDDRGNGFLYVRGAPERHPTLGKLVCKVNIHVDYPANGANGRLIAAAPELLEALRRVELVADHEGPADAEYLAAWAFARAALANAEGGGL